MRRKCVVAELPLVLDVPGSPPLLGSAWPPGVCLQCFGLRHVRSRSLHSPRRLHSLLRSKVDLTRRLATATYTRGRGGKSILTGVVGECAILIAGVSLVTSCTDYATKTLDIVFRRTLSGVEFSV